MFNFMLDIGNYEDRKIARYEKGDIFVSTAKVSDGEKSFETGVAHPRYNDGSVIIVEAYNTIEEAKKGHDKWVKIFTSDDLPEIVEDCANAKLGQFLKSMNKSALEHPFRVK